MGDQVVEPYRDIPHSIEKVTSGIRTDRNDRELHVWAIDALRAAGCDGRTNDCSIRRKTQALLDAIRAQTIYVPDPVGSEHIQATHVTLCLRDKCVPAEDCDGLIRALVSALLSIGISSYIVIQEFGPGVQPHVLAGVIDEYGEQLYADPANTMSPVYTGSRATSEVWIDPMSAEQGWKGPEMVTLGSVPERKVSRQGGLWTEDRYGRTWVYRGKKWQDVTGLGSSGGSLLFWHSAHELDDLLKALTYQVAQIDAAIRASRVAWQQADPAAEQEWMIQYQSTLDIWTPLAAQATAFVQAVRQQAAGNLLAADWDWTPAISNTGTDLFDAVAKAFKPFIELDRELRATSTYPGPLPAYPDTPQPTAPDFVLDAYQMADSAWQKVKQVGLQTQSFMEAAAPWIAVGAVVIASYAVIQVVNVLPVSRRR